MVFALDQDFSQQRIKALTNHFEKKYRGQSKEALVQIRKNIRAEERQLYREYKNVLFCEACNKYSYFLPTGQIIGFDLHSQKEIKERIETYRKEKFELKFLWNKLYGHSETITAEEALHEFWIRYPLAEKYASKNVLNPLFMKFLNSANIIPKDLIWNSKNALKTITHLFPIS